MPCVSQTHEESRRHGIPSVYNHIEYKHEVFLQYELRYKYTQTHLIGRNLNYIRHAKILKPQRAVAKK